MEERRVVEVAVRQMKVLRALWVFVAAIVVLPSLCLGDQLRRGDANVDGQVNISDPVGSLNVLFGGADPFRCVDAADGNDDGAVNVSDPVYVLNFLFAGGSSPPPPFPDCGDDPTADDLDCASYPECPPDVECTPVAEIEAEVEASVPTSTCVPEDALQEEIEGFTVTVCSAAEAEACGEDGLPGCDVDIDQVEVDIDPAAGEAFVRVEGEASELPVTVVSELLGTTVCSVNLPFSTEVIVPFTTVPRGDGAVEIVSLGTPIFDSVDVDMTASGGFICELFEAAKEQVIEQLVVGVEEASAELLTSVAEDLLGRVICLE